MMTDLVAYKKMPQWTAQTMPEGVKHQHNTKEGTWGQIRVLSGRLKFYELTQDGQVTAEHIFTPETAIPLVQPQAWHKVEALTDDLVMQLTFYCQPEDYWAKKYQLGKPHSEVLEAAPNLPLGKVLDLGCGQGRNALYLAQGGFEVTALDINSTSLEKLASMAEAEGLDLTIQAYDINKANLGEDYDVIISTVVFMFLQADRLPDILRNMQAKTKPGGYNLIVCAMDTEDAPCHLPFPFTFKEGELRAYYEGWDLLKYNEDFGHLHRLDQFGNPIRLRFATMLARKPD